MEDKVMSNINEYVKNLNLNVPISDEEIDLFEKEIGIKLPYDYVEFLKMGNGGEGFVGENSYIIFWNLNEIIEINKAYNVKEYVPGLLLFASSGGGEAYAFDIRNKSMPLVKVPFIGMSLNEIEYISPKFITFLEILSKD